MKKLKRFHLFSGLAVLMIVATTTYGVLQGPLGAAAAVTMVSGTSGNAVPVTGIIDATFASTSAVTTASVATWRAQTSGLEDVSSDIKDVSFVSATEGWAVGSSGKIRHTSDAGATWTEQTSGTTANFTDVSFVSATKGWALTDTSRIFKTSNGSTWAEQLTGLADSSYDISFASATHGWAVGNAGSIIATTDGGTTWTAQTSNASQTLSAVQAVSSTVVYAVGGYGEIVKTTDGGTTWTSLRDMYALWNTTYFTSLHFLDADTGWAVGGSTIIYTTNGGTSWTTQTQYSLWTISDVAFYDANNGFVVDSSGGMLTTANAGTTWTSSYSTGTTNWASSINAIHVVDGSTGWIVGNSGLIMTLGITATPTWTVNTTKPGENFNDVFFVNGTTGYAVDALSNIYKTTDSGVTWTAQTSNNMSPGIRAIYCVDTNTCWAAGAYGSIYYTTTGGTTWGYNYAGFDKANDVFFIDASNGWVVSDYGAMYKTTNGGSSWSSMTSGTSQDLYGIYFSSATNGWAVGASGTILATTDGGTNWAAQTSGASVSLNGVYATDSTDVWAVGDTGTILATTDGGTNWAAQTSGITTNIAEVRFVSGTVGWAVGASSQILYTDDAGATWTPQTAAITANFTGVSFTDASTGFVVGNNGTVVSTTNAGTAWAVARTGIGANMNDFVFVSGTTGFGVGDSGMIVKTTDGGATWSILTNSGVNWTTSDLKSVDFVSTTTGWVVGTSAILKTTDGGDTWTLQDNGGSPWAVSALYKIDCVSTSKCWAAEGGGNVYYTADGGTTWTAQVTGTSSVLYGISFVDENTGFAVGTNGAIVKTTDGGANWAVQTSSISGTLANVEFIDANNGYAVGASSMTGGIIKTTDGGANWTLINDTGSSFNYGYYADLDFTDANNGSIISGNTVIHTANGGTTWSSDVMTTSPSGSTALAVYDSDTGIYLGTNGQIFTLGTSNVSGWTAQTDAVVARSGVNLTDVDFLDASTGCAVGKEGSVVCTADGGATWATKTSNTSAYLRGVSFGDTALAVAVGDSGTVLKSIDSGETWAASTSGSENLLDVDFTNETTGIAVGANGTILKTTDGGTNWTSKTSGVTSQLNRVHFVTSLVAYAVGANGDMLKSADAGDTWAALQNNGTNWGSSSLYDVYFLDANTGWAVGDYIYNFTTYTYSSGVLKTTDGGATWTDGAPTMSSSSLYAVRFFDSNNGIIVSTFGSVYVTTDGGATWSGGGTLSYPTRLLMQNAISGVYVSSSGAVGQYAPTVLLQKNTGNTQTGLAAGMNLCSEVAIDTDTNRMTCTNPILDPNTYYTLMVKGGANGVTTSTSELLASDYTSVFKTSSFEGGAEFNSVPELISSTPGRWGGSIPANGDIVLTFSKEMAGFGSDGSVKDKNNIQLYALDSSWTQSATNLFESADTWSLSYPTTELRIPLPTGLTVGGYYRLIIKGDNDYDPFNGSCGGASEPYCVVSSDGLSMNGWDTTIDFTLNEADASAPTVIATSPAAGATGVDIAESDILINFSEEMDPTTVTSVELRQDDGDGVLEGDQDSTISTTITFDADKRTVHIAPASKLVASTKYFIVAGGAEEGTFATTQKDNSGNSLATTYSADFTTGTNVNGASSDTSQSQIVYAYADNSSVAITFSEPMISTLSTSNFRVETSDDLSSWNEASISGGTVSYYPPEKTAIIRGITLPPGSYFRVHGLAGITGIGTPGVTTATNTVMGTVLSTDATLGKLLPGSADPNWSVYMYPQTALTGATTNYTVSLTAYQAIPAAGKIILTFPSGYTFASACNTWDSTLGNNADINNYWADGSPTIASISCNSIARTITMTLGDEGIGEWNYVSLQIPGIINPLIEKAWPAHGYNADLKTFNASGLLLESKSTPQYYINSGGSRTISGTIFIDNGSGGNANNNKLDSGELGIASVDICISGDTGQYCTQTGGDGTYTFSQLSNNTYYYISVPPIESGNYIVQSYGQWPYIGTSNITDLNFGVSEISTENILNVGVDGATALASQQVDVMAWATYIDPTGGANGNFGYAKKTVTLDGSGNGTAALPLSRGTWQVVVMPAMDYSVAGTGKMGSADFLSPQPSSVEVNETGVVDICTQGAQAEANELCFSLQAASSQILGKVVDGQGAAIANAYLWARPAFAEEGNWSGGSSAQSDDTGNFTFKVVADTYIIQAYVPGMPESNSFTCEVKENDVANSDNNSTADVYCDGTLTTNDVAGFATATISGTADANDFVVAISKGDTTISGLVLDENSNPLSNVPVSTHEVDVDGNYIGGWSSAQTDDSGAYTLYVKGGTGTSTRKWKIESYASTSCGALPAITVSVTSGSNLTGKNIQEAEGACVTVEGAVYQDINKNGSQDTDEGLADAWVSVYGASGSNYTITDSNGNYNVKIVSGTGYTIEGWSPNKGRTSVLTNQDLSANRTGKNLSIYESGTLVVYVCTLTNASAAASAVNNCGSNQISTAYVYADASNDMGTGAGVSATPGEYTLGIPEGTYSVTVNDPSIGDIGTATTVTIVANETTYVNFAPPTLYTLSGTVTSTDDSCIEDAALYINGGSAGSSISAVTNAVGAWSASVPSGTYEVAASKSGCVDNAEPEEVTVGTTPATATARTLVKADATIAGRVWIDANSNDTADSGENVTTKAIVTATSADGNVVVAEVDTSAAAIANNYSLSVTGGTWTVEALGQGYESTASAVTVASAGSQSKNIELTAVTGYEFVDPVTTSVTPSLGGVVNTDAADITLGVGVLGGSSIAGTIVIEKGVAPSTPTQTVIEGTAVDVTATNSVGQPIQNLNNGGATITIPYDQTLVGTSTPSIGVWSETKGQYELLPTVCNATAGTCTAKTPHFSKFAIVKGRNYGDEVYEKSSSRNRTPWYIAATLIVAIGGVTFAILNPKRHSRRKKS